MTSNVTRVVLSLLLLALAAVSYKIDLGYHASYIGSNDGDNDGLINFSNVENDNELIRRLTAVSYKIDLGYHPSYIGSNDGDDNGLLDLSNIENDNELMRRLSSSTTRLPLDTEETRGLQYLYNSTNGDDWSWNTDTVTYGIPWNFTGDLSSVNPCYDHWQGILCTCNTSYTLNPPYSKSHFSYYYYDDITSYIVSTDSCHIKKIFLNQHNLDGVLPGEMFALLPNLTHLHVEYNSLYSPLPSEMNQSSLILLDIKDNYFLESLDALCCISTLNVLIASNNGFTGGLSPLQLLDALYYLDLQTNSLTGDLTGARHFVGLKRLYLGLNQLIGTVDAVSNLKSLLALDLHNNQLTGTIDAVSSLTSLYLLDLSNNQFNGTIDTVSSLTSLNALYLDNNQLTGTIDAVRDLTNLYLLDLHNNRLTGTIDAVRDLTSLNVLYLDTNQFNGTIDAVRDLTNLNLLTLYSNQFTGTIDAVRDLTSLYLLALYSNQLTGTIDAISSLTSLYWLALFSNQLIGTIDAVSNLRSLCYVYLGINHFTGTIDAVSGLTSLNILWMDNNQFNGTIDAVRDLTSLSILWLDTNQFTGTIDAVRDLTSLNWLVLFSNQFNGTIDAVRDLTSLYLLALYSNHFTGTIDAVRDLTSLNALSMNDNQLTGTIDAVRDLISVIALDLRSNKLTGTIEATSNLTSLVVLLLQSNQFTGTIEAVRDLTHLVAIYLSYNMFTGTLEPLVGNLQLQFCIMDHNSFTGAIPSLYNATELLVFAVGHNLLTGTLDPYRFSDSINVIGVSNNMLSGELSMDVFKLPNLQILAVGINCITARFTDLVCSASALQVLILDGIHSSSSCRNLIPIRVFDTIYESYQSVSSIPSCLYSLPNMTNLRLSGNDITGSLPSDATLNEGFVELIISSNQFTSIIPESFQSHRWEVFDVSYNKFSGSLLPSLYISNDATLKINRISGAIPLSLYNTTDVDVLTGNIFTCNSEQLALLGDKVEDRYVCGSSSFTNAGLTWFTVVIVIMATIAISYISYSDNSNTSIKRWIANILVLLHEIRIKFISSSDLTRVASLLSDLKLPINELQQFNSLCRTIRSAAGLVTGFFVCVHLPLYCVLSSSFSTYTTTYAWTASAAYLSGAAPGATLFVLYLFTLVVPCYLYFYKSHLRSVLLECRGDSRVSNTGVEKNVEMAFVVENPLLAPAIQTDVKHEEKSDRDSRRRLSMTSVMVLSTGSGANVISDEAKIIVKRRFLSMLLVSTVNFAVVSTLNFAYVITILNCNESVTTVVDIAMGLFKALWTNVVVVGAISWFDVHYNTGQRLSFVTITSILNNIVMPCIALSLASPNCFYNLLYSREDVSSSFRTEFLYTSDTFVVDGFDVVLTLPVSYDSRLVYTPSFSYSYQCSSTILTSYVVIFLYSTLFALISQPIIDRFHKNAAIGKETITQYFITGTNNNNEGSSKSGVVTDRIPINSTYFILHQVTMGSVMLSFGCVFPFLSFILFITIIFQTKYVEYRIGKYVETTIKSQALPEDVKIQRINRLNDQLRDMQYKFLLALWQIIPCLGPFYGIFIFDIIGDASSMKEAIFAPIVLFVLSIGVYLTPYVAGTNINAGRVDGNL